MSEPAGTAATTPQPTKTARLIAADMIARGSSIADAAHAAGVTRSTTHRWHTEDAAFQRLVQQRLADQEAMETAVRSVMTDPKTPPSTRLQAVVLLAELTSVEREGVPPYGLLKLEEISTLLSKRARDYVKAKEGGL